MDVEMRYIDNEESAYEDQIEDLYHNWMFEEEGEV